MNDETRFPPPNSSASDNESMISYVREAVPVSPIQNVFRRGEKLDRHRELVRKHRAWLDLVQHEYPLPYIHYKIGVYIRYFNQTEYANYLSYHKKQFRDTVALCPNGTVPHRMQKHPKSCPEAEGGNALDWASAEV